MADLVFVLIIVGFFSLMVLLVRACDHVIGPDPVDASSSEPDAVRDERSSGVTA